MISLTHLKLPRAPVFQVFFVVSFMEGQHLRSTKVVHLQSAFKFSLTPGPNVPETLPAVRCNVAVAVDHHGYPLVENVQNHLPWRVGGHESLIQVPCEVLEPLNFHQKSNRTESQRTPK